MNFRPEYLENTPQFNHSLEGVEGVIFDLDGTLVDSSLDFQAMKAQIGCPADEDIIDYIQKLPSQEARASAHSIVAQHELDDAEQSNWMPGAQALVQQLKRQSIPMAIVTRNCRQATRIKIKRNRIPIEQIITREDAPAKPDPTSLIRISAQWKMASHNILYVGDHLYDVYAAHRAAMLACLYVPGKLPVYVNSSDYVCRNLDLLATALDRTAHLT
ncbi:HAD family hydrolase [Echinimonas agarilytica]|uniref:HAD family hydrolase n=1 Tax=Echinimonas agarilytica TaxID=1215918 RepID=A0AA41WC02_9GAMM|nr:HAD-IA family hydrolase [Echinimonas agarilytica]MCM2681396.1 HAD family hydrolase [Echinimonas agarilytica]